MQASNTPDERDNDTGIARWIGFLLLIIGIGFFAFFCYMIRPEKIEPKPTQAIGFYTAPTEPQQGTAEAVVRANRMQEASGFDSMGNSMFLLEQKVTAPDGNTLTVSELIEAYEELNH